MNTTSTKITDKKLAPFFKSHPKFNILNFKFHDRAQEVKLRAQIKSKGKTDDEATETLERLKTYQRLLKIHPHGGLAEKLLSRGLVSANHIAKIPKNMFVKNHAAALGLDNKAAEKLHDKANTIRTNTMHLWATVRGSVASPVYRNSKYNTLDPGVASAFENLPSYEEMFGTLNYCSCDECSSIFGPAAYLVDLLRIIDEYITKPNSNIKHQNLFTTRRPDIGNIALNCLNTNSVVPSLQIVNEVLLNYLVTNLNGVPANPPATLAQQQDYVLQQMASTIVFPGSMQFNVPLNSLTALLTTAGTSFSAVLSAWQVSADIVAASCLSLSPEQQNNVITPQANETEIDKFYNVSDSKLLNTTDTFINQMQISYQDLQTLFNQDLTSHEQQAGLQVNFFINQGLGSNVFLTVQGSGIYPNPFPLAALDQINRISRLSNISGISVTDLDWALRCIQGGSAPVISNPALITLSQLVSLSNSLSISLQSASALLGPIKTYGSNSQFDALFNPASLVAQYGLYQPTGNNLNPLYISTPLNWTPGLTTSGNISAISRVLPGLTLSIQDANALGAALYGQNPVQLTVDTLSSLYRHALLCNSLQIPMQSYLVLIHLVGLAAPASPTINEINNIVSLAQWVNSNGITVYQLNYIINNVLTVYVNPLYDSTQVSTWQASLIKNVPVTNDAEETTAICNQIAGLFNVDAALITDLINLLMSLPGGGVIPWQSFFLDTTKLVFVQAALNYVSRWLVLIQGINLPVQMLSSMQSNPLVYQLSPGAMLAAPNLTAVQSIQVVNGMMITYNDQQQNLLAVIDMLPAPPWTLPPNATILNTLQNATGWNPQDVTNLLPVFNITSLNQVTGLLSGMQTCFNIMSQLGADTGLMASIVQLGGLMANTTQNWTSYNTVADTVLAKLIAQYGQSWQQVSANVMGNLALNQREAMLSLVLSMLNEMDSSITTYQNVYEYLLTNVEIGSAAQTSYIVEATGAAQLYLQRCRLMLEPDVTDLSNINEVWWEWLLNYRVWQANREIFVYPENYLIPGLQQNTTPLFQQLSQTLQQTNITPTSSNSSFLTSVNNEGQNATVENAYTSYINGFAQVSNITVVDSHYARVNNQNVLYLIGVQKTSPGTFYYCYQKEGSTWTVWQKIDLTINSTTATLVYAFNRLFVFWTEIAQNNSSTVSGTSAGNIQTNFVTSATASVMYSFINLDLKWVQPQILVDKQTIYYNSDGYTNSTFLADPLFKGDFEFTNSLWNKVSAIRVTANNYSPPNNNLPEKLVIIWGPNLNNTGSTSMLDSSGKRITSPFNYPTQIDPTTRSFWNNLNQQEENNYRVIAGQLSGNINLQAAKVFNFSLKEDELVSVGELILTDSYQINGLPGLRAGITSDRNSLLVTNSAQVLADSRMEVTASSPDLSAEGVNLINPSSGTCLAFAVNGITQTQSISIYAALQKTSPAVIDAGGNVIPSAIASLNLYQALLGLDAINTFGPDQYQSIMGVLYSCIPATLLFNTLSSFYSKVIPVNGQPGWFIVYLDDEVFLLSPPTTAQQPFLSTADGMVVGSPSITPAFANSCITPTLSQTVFNALVSANIITVNGYILPNNTLYNSVITVLKGVSGVSASTYNSIYNCLINANNLVYQTVSPSFASGYVSQSISQTVFNNLVTNNLLSSNGIIQPTTNYYTDVKGVLNTSGVPANLVDNVYSCLINAPVVFNDSFINTSLAIDIITSQNIYNALAGTSSLLIDSLGRLNKKLPDVLTYNNVQNWLNGVKDSQNNLLSVNQIASVYQVLIKAPVPITLNYTNRNGSVNLNGLVFNVNRLSTNAINNLSEALFAGGVPALLNLSTQQIPVVPQKPFSRFGAATNNVNLPATLDATQADFDLNDLYGQYFWEIFYHIPMLVAYTLNTQQQFQVAQTWYQYIFNPAVPPFQGVTAGLIYTQTDESISQADATSVIASLQNVSNGIPAYNILSNAGKVNKYFNSHTDLMFLASNLSSNQIFLLQGLLLSTQSLSGTLTAQQIQVQLNITATEATTVFGLLQSHAVDAAPILDSSGFVNNSFSSSTSLSFLSSIIPATQIQMVANILLNSQLISEAGNYWQFFPFRNHTIESMIEIFNNTTAVSNYQNSPFDPFAIANLRIGAYEKATFMQYVDNLIAWGDQLFTQNTRESITAAYMIYVYASDLLGPKPVMVGACESSNSPLTFNQISAQYPDGIPVFLIDLELFPSSSGQSPSTMDHAFNDLPVYFCVPENTNLMARWDTVADRINKINLSENIDGVFQQLPLFQPPINPLDLVKAGGNINNLLNSINSSSHPVPYFRYSTSLATATNLCDVLIDLGNTLLSTLERSDAEGLALLQNTQEAQIQQMTLQIKQNAISEIQSTLNSLNANLQGAQTQLNYYTGLLGEGLSDYEITNIVATTLALEFNVLSSITQTAASIGYAVPQVGSPFAMTYGGEQIGNALNAASGVLNIGAQVSNYVAQMALTMGGYDRRNQEWNFQLKLAQSQLASINAQIEATKLQLQSAQQDLAIQQTTIAQNKAMASFLQNKFTNQALYQWMAGQLNTTYYQTFGIAMQAARQAEAAYQFELDSDQTFINYNYWNSQFKGLTSGQGLRLALNQLDVAYRAGDNRRLEIEKTISLAMTDPQALLNLKTQGTCNFTFTEAMFDYDHPGHYSRKITSISISIPVVLGPYQNINATLTQKWNCVVTGNNNNSTNNPSIADVTTLLQNNPPANQPAGSTGLRVNWGLAGQSIAVSSGVNDTGMFVLDFNDPRYLPFENTGAVSNWTLDMPINTNYFDFNQISDVIINIKYTALSIPDSGPSSFPQQVKGLLATTYPLTGGIFVDCNSQSSAWQTFLITPPVTTPTTSTQTLLTYVPNISVTAFKAISFTTLVVQLVLGDSVTIPKGINSFSFLSVNVVVDGTPVMMDLNLINTNGVLIATPPSFNWNGLNIGTTWEFVFNLKDPNIGFILTKPDGSIDGTKLLDVQFITTYEAKVNW